MRWMLDLLLDAHGIALLQASDVLLPLPLPAPTVATRRVPPPTVYKAKRGVELEGYAGAAGRNRGLGVGEESAVLTRGLLTEKSGEGGQTWFSRATAAACQ